MNFKESLEKGESDRIEFKTYILAQIAAKMRQKNLK